MKQACSCCARPFDRGPGYLLGSIYFNYGVTALLVVFAYFGLYFGTQLAGAKLLWIVGGFSLLFPLWFFRYARSLWIAFDERWDPWTPKEASRAASSKRADQAEPRGTMDRASSSEGTTPE